MESGLSPNEIAVVAKGDTPLGDGGVEVGKGVEVLVDYGLIDVDHSVSAGCSSGV